MALLPVFCHADPVTPILLGPVEGGVGVLHKDIAGCAILRKRRDPQRQGHGLQDPLRMAHPQLAGGLSDLLGPPLRHLHGGVVQDDRELLPPVAAGDVLGSNLPLEEGAQLPEKGITGIVTQGVVKALEMVDVQHDDAERLP